MPALLLAGTRFLIAGSDSAGLVPLARAAPELAAETMLMLGAVGLLLLGGERGPGCMRSDRAHGLASRRRRVVPLYVALIEMALPGGEPAACARLAGCCVGHRGTGRAALALAPERPSRRQRAPVGHRQLAGRRASWTVVASCRGARGCREHLCGAAGRC